MPEKGWMVHGAITFIGELLLCGTIRAYTDSQFIITAILRFQTVIIDRIIVIHYIRTICTFGVGGPKSKSMLESLSVAEVALSLAS